MKICYAYIVFLYVLAKCIKKVRYLYSLFVVPLFNFKLFTDYGTKPLAGLKYQLNGLHISNMGNFDNSVLLWFA